LSGPDRTAFANVGAWIGARAALHPDRVAIHAEGSGERLTYAELERLSNRIAHFVRAVGVRPGDRIAVALRSEPLYLGAYFAAAKAGAILVPLNTRLAPPELAFQLEDARPRLLLRGPGIDALSPPGGEVIGREELLRRLPLRDDEPEMAPGGEAPQVLMYTSGTSGLPKGALLPHRKTVFNTLNAEIYLELRAGDVVVVPVPLFHSFGLKILAVPALFAGATVVLVDRFDPIAIQEGVARHRATLLGGVPVMYQRMLAAGLQRERLASLRMAFSAGAPLEASLPRSFHESGVALVQGYGQTETSILCALDREHALSKAGSVGRAVRHGEVRIVDESGAAVEPGVAGEVVARGPIVMLGYWRRSGDADATRLRPYHRTGDLGVADEEGFVTLVGRLKDLYISGGENVYPAEVERVLEQHPNVAECAVVGVPHPEWGETGRAYVVPARLPLEREDLLRWVRERLAGYKVPREVVLVSELPRTASGKVQKRRLVELGDA
jgi:fatty-acyl-CoA synthase